MPLSSPVAGQAASMHSMIVTFGTSPARPLVVSPTTPAPCTVFFTLQLDIVVRSYADNALRFDEHLDLACFW